MNVWVIGRNYPEPSNQMCGSFELEQAKTLGRKGLKVSYLAVSLHIAKKIKSGGFQQWTEDEISIFTYSKIFMPRIYPFYMGAWRDKIWATFLKMVEENTGKPDVIHVHYPIMLLLANVLEEYHKKGVKIVVTEHWSKVLVKKLDSYEIKQQKKYVNMVDSYICVGSPLKDAITEITDLSRDMLVIPNIVNKAFVPNYNEHDGFEFISVGRLVPLKQFDKIITAFAELFKGNRNLQLTIVGGGEEAEHLKSLINKLDMADQVELTGSLNRTDTAKRVAGADCLICYSTFETFGVPIIEAWACGIPAITTTAAAVMDDFDIRLGQEVSPYDFEELKRIMKYIYNHKDEYDKKYIVDYANRHFSEDVIAEKLIEIYDA